MADDDSRAGTRYATRPILDWCAQTHAAHDAALARAFATPEGVPAIMVGPSEGHLLHLFCKLVGAKKVVEIGTLVGYSTIHMARALAPGGHLWTIEFDPKHAAIARDNIAAAGLADRVTVLEGAGVDVLPTLEPLGPFDVVFIDADKVSYERYGAWAVANLRPGGLVLGDNSFLFGELMDETDRGRAMRGFHQLLAKTCDSVNIPTPDGLALGIKRGS